jgi:hypothetical protein
VISLAEKDRLAYSLARDYLLSFSGHGITSQLLDEYVNPPQPESKHESLKAVFQRLVTSAQNANMKAGVIGGSIGGVVSLAKVLHGFDPHQVHTQYGDDWTTLLKDIEAKLKPKGKIRKTSRSIWPQFCRSVLSGAEFLSQFKNGADFSEWVDVFDEDDTKRPALPMLLAAQVRGFGFPLACDFLKEIGYLNFCKPDIHVKTIFKGLNLVPEKATNFEVFKAVTRVARSNEVTPYNADKTFWLVGSGFFYKHKTLGQKGKIPTDREVFVEDTHRRLAEL